MYPALTVVEALKIDRQNLLWVGGQGGMEEALVKRENLSYLSIPAAGVHGVDLKKLPGNLLKLVKGYSASRRILKDFKPDALFFTGGYVAIPMALAGNHLPSVLYVPDIEPGMALKFLARFARRIALTTESSRKFFSSKENATVTGYPIRQGLAKWTKKEARAYFNISGDRPVILFMGGSSGARSINNAVLEILPDLVKKYQVIHITGHLDWEMIQTKSASFGSNYQSFPYLHEVGAALAAADLVVSRAGASTLGEYPLFELPAILVPYPYAWRYQKVNAEFLVAHNAAVMLLDETLNTTLLKTIDQLMSDENQLKRMRKAMAALAQPEAAMQIAELINEVAEV